MIKLLIFDLDGVLVDAKDIHYRALNRALAEVGEQYMISPTEHISKFDGLKTTDKLSLLVREKGLPSEKTKQVWRRKQEFTMEEFSAIEWDGELVAIFKELKSRGFELVCASNSIRETVYTALAKLGIFSYFNNIICNEDVNSKPHPEAYWVSMALNKAFPHETLIIEDSPHGLFAAHTSNANVLRVKNRSDLTLTKILSAVQPTNKKIPKWKDDKLNVLIPMAGAGSRFKSVGYKLPKPLIDVDGLPMIAKVVENLNMDANFIFLVQKEHFETYNLEVILNLIASGCKIVVVDGLTEGAACTTLLAKEFINNDNPLIIANSDQIVEWNSNEFMYSFQENGVDGGIVTFTATEAKWSFAKTDESGYVTEVAEKNPISDIATVGIYYWKHGSDYVKFAEQMIEKNIRVNNEFYVCPVFNEAILDGKKIRTFAVPQMWGIGTPEDLEKYLKR